MKKLLSLLLALVLVLALVPMTVSAADSIFEYAEIRPNNDPTTEAPYIGTRYDHTKVPLSQEAYDSLMAQYKAHLIYLEELEKAANHPAGEHSFGWASNTKYHWLGCPCGCQISMEPHIDPKDAEDDYCICGYKFSDNADLVTLWVNGCPGIENFNKDSTEYELKAYTYKDVKEIKISTRTFDSEATVELPEDLTLKEGENTFEVKVIAENQKNTKTYTLTILKESK